VLTSVNMILRGAAFLSLFAILLLSLVPGEYRPHTSILPSEFEHVSAYTFEHVSAYTIAGFLLWLGYGRISPIRLVLMLTAYGALLEVAQLWVPGRHGQAVDIVADFVGALFGVLVASVLARRISQAVPEVERRPRR
jgi:VanZ family protein